MAAINLSRYALRSRTHFAQSDEEGIMIKAGIYSPWIKRQRRRYDHRCQWRILLTLARERSAKRLDAPEPRRDCHRRRLPTYANSIAATSAKSNAVKRTSRSKPFSDSRVPCGRLRPRFSVRRDIDETAAQNFRGKTRVHSYTKLGFPIAVRLFLTSNAEAIYRNSGRRADLTCRNHAPRRATSA